MKIKSITATIHDTGYGGYPYKIIVLVEVPVTEFNKRCPVTVKAERTPYGNRPAKRDLGNLVLEVNNAVYALNRAIPAYNPSIDSRGSSRARNGLKTLEFVYFMNDHERAKLLGFQFHERMREPTPKQYQSIDLYKAA
jgi:hypothetical protein